MCVGVGYRHGVIVVCHRYLFLSESSAYASPTLRLWYAYGTNHFKVQVVQGVQGFKGFKGSRRFAFGFKGSRVQGFKGFKGFKMPCGQFKGLRV